MEEKKTKKKAPVSLVTGSCGFMGTHMIEVLLKAGHTIRATDLASAYAADDKETGRFPSVLKKNNVEFTPSDLTRPETLAPLVKGVDYIFHIASVFSYTTPWETLYRVNVEGGRALYKMAAAEKKLKKFVLWGAGGVYGPPKKNREIFTEDMAAVPGNDYLLSKWQMEYDLIELGRKSDIKYAIMRPTTVYGPRGVYGGGQMVMEAAKMKTAAMPSNFDAHIPFVHVEDVCGAALFLAENENIVNEIFNLNDDTMITTMQYFEFVAKYMGHKFVKLPPVPVTPLRTVLTGVATVIEKVSEITGVKTPLEKDSTAYFGLDFKYSNDKLKDAGYKFKYADARDGLKDTIEWYKSEGWIK